MERRIERGTGVGMMLAAVALAIAAATIPWGLGALCSALLGATGYELFRPHNDPPRRARR